MSMPLGYKCTKQYVTLKHDGHQPMQFRRIAEIMTNRGMKMNHATARGVLLQSLRTLASSIVDKNLIDKIIYDERFQSFIGDICLEQYR